MIRIYLMPKAGDGLTPQTAFRPKYADTDSVAPGWSPGPFVGMDYGAENAFLVAFDLDDAQDTALAAMTDVVGVPALSQTVTAGALAVAQTRLEAINIPADWITTSMTWRQVVRRVVRMIQLMQRFHGMFGRLLGGGITLDTTINQIPANARTRLATAAQSMGANTSAITGTTTIRAALVIIADQLFTADLEFAGMRL